MLERAALHQTRFRTPGVSPDVRGVLLGQQGLLLFPSLDRLVAFLRGYAEQDSMDEIIPSLMIRRLRTGLGTLDLGLFLAAESSYRMDRVAAIAKLAGGMCFTGTARHFVKYRDAAAPLGYDIDALLEEPADLIVYHDAFQQAYGFDHEISLRSLVFTLAPEPLPSGRREAPTIAIAAAEIGVGGALIGYLYRWQVRATVAFAEWPPQSAFDDVGERRHLFRLVDAPARVLELLHDVPGIDVYVPVPGIADSAVGNNAIAGCALPWGYRHPIALDACASLFTADALHLFAKDGRVRMLQPAPVSVPVDSLVRTNLNVDPPVPAAAASGPQDADDQGPRRVGRSPGRNMGIDLPLRLVPHLGAPAKVIASRVPMVERDWLARLLYVLPPSTLGALRVAVTADAFYLLCPGGIEGVPLGRFYGEVARRIYVPTGFTLAPAVRPTVLESLVSGRGDGHVFFEVDAAVPEVIPDAAFAAPSHGLIRHVCAIPLPVSALDEEELPWPILRYPAARRFPLWGLPPSSLPSGAAHPRVGMAELIGDGDPWTADSAPSAAADESTGDALANGDDDATGGGGRP